MLPNEKELAHETEMRLADFAERTAAFGLDYGIFAIGWLASLKLVFPQYGIEWNPHATSWTLLWTALFLLYQAYFSCEGRATLGKSALGLRVVTVDNEPLSLGQAITRSFCYLPSSILSLGFLWSLLSPNRQTWHDLAAGSYVVSERRVPLVLARAGAAAVLAVFGVAWMWQNVWSPRYHRTMLVAYAHVGLSEVAQLQKVYHKKNGRYAESLVSLALVSENPKVFLSDMAGLYDLKRGFDIRTSRAGYTVSAVAKDRFGTPVSYTGS